MNKIPSTATATQPLTPPTNWHEFFNNWPTSISRRGVLVTSFGERFTFSDFITSDAFLVVKRETPDIDGARTIVLDYDGVCAVKIVDLMKPRTVVEFGFGGAVDKPRT